MIPSHSGRDWASPDGMHLIKTVLTEKIPQWPSGPYDWQVITTANILNGHRQLVVAGCGEGKTAGMYLHLHVRQELFAKPHLPRFGIEVVPAPVALIVSPLIDLARCQEKEIRKIGLRAWALDAKSIGKAHSEGRNPYREIMDCQWSVVITSPERLVLPEFDHVLRNKKFRQNLVVFAPDEAHVIKPWGKEFRDAYKEIPRLCARIPNTVPILLATATLTAAAQEALVRLMGFRDGEYFVVRRPVARPNMRIVFQTLTHGLGGDEFPNLGWIALGQAKVVIFCPSTDLGWRLASFLWRLRPPGELERKRNIRLYNGVTDDGTDDSQTLEDFRTDPATFAVIATVKFGMGVDLPHIDVSVNLGLPDSAEAIVQQNGRAGRDPTRTALGITYVEASYVAAILREKADTNMRKDTRTHGAPPRHAMPMGAGHRQSPMNDPNIRYLVGCHANGECLVVALNKLFAGPSPPSHDLSSCLEVQGRLHCSSCLLRVSPHLRPPLLMTAPIPRPSGAEIANGLTDSNPEEDEADAAPEVKHKKLTEKQRQRAASELNEFCIAAVIRSDLSAHQVLPPAAFLDPNFRKAILKDFHKIRDREELAEILLDWEPFDVYGNKLCDLIRRLNREFDAERQQVKEVSKAKASATRAKNAELHARDLLSAQRSQSGKAGGSAQATHSAVPSPPRLHQDARENARPTVASLSSPTRKRGRPRTNTQLQFSPSKRQRR